MTAPATRALATRRGRGRTSAVRLAGAAFVALLLQVPFVLGLRFALLGGTSDGAPDDEAATDRSEVQLVAVTEDEAPASLEPAPPVDGADRAEPEAPAEVVAPDPIPPVALPLEPEPEIEPEVAEPSPPPPQPPPPDALAVAQAQSNDVEPVDTRHIADRANTVVDETVAENTTLRDPGPDESGGRDDAPLGDTPGDASSEHGEDAPAPDDADAAQAEQVTGAPDRPSLEPPDPASPEPSEPEQALAALTPDERPPSEANEPVEPGDAEPPELAPDPEPGPTPVEAPPRTGLSLQDQLDRAREAVEANPDAAELAANVALPDASDWVEVFGDRDAADRIRLEQNAREASLIGDHRGETERTRAALMNFGVHAHTGTETHLNARADSTAGYIHHLHSYIHPEWEAYLLRLETTLGPGSVMADPNLHTRLEWVIGGDGRVENVAVVQSSGQILFDVEAINLLYRLDPVRPPPIELRSPDGNTYVHWSFRRDQRMCYTGGASVRFVGATEFEDESATAPL